MTPSAGSTAAAAPCGLLGAAVGVILRNPALAACAIVLWSYAAEPFISALSYRAYIYLPGGARESLVHHHPAHHYIPPRRWPRPWPSAGATPHSGVPPQA